MSSTLENQSFPVFKLKKTQKYWIISNGQVLTPNIGLECLPKKVFSVSRKLDTKLIFLTLTNQIGTVIFLLIDCE